jgi:hypothetical protein
MVLQPGYGAVPPSPTYSNVTITSTGATTAPIYTTGTGIASPWVATNSDLKGGMIYLDGKDADVVINGHSLTDTLKALEERLNILVPNTELEKEWVELKRIGDRYRKLEADLTEKAAMWAALKAEDR